MKPYCRFFLILLLFFVSIQAFALNTADLIKVTPSTEASCVSFYFYKGQIYCSTSASDNSAPTDPRLIDQEKLNIVFDNRPWQIASGQQRHERFQIQYFPMGQNVNNWSETILSEFYPDLQKKFNPRRLAEILMTTIKKDREVNINILEENSNRIIYETKVQQYTLWMITQDDRALYVLVYIKANPDVDQKTRDKWIQNLKNTTIRK